MKRVIIESLCPSPFPLFALQNVGLLIYHAVSKDKEEKKHLSRAVARSEAKALYNRAVEEQKNVERARQRILKVVNN